MIEVRGDPPSWQDGHLDGLVRDDRRSWPDDGLRSGVECALGDAPGGPSLMLSITRRLFPRRAPVHRHKSDTFRMALGSPIVVGRTEYPHGSFRLQQADRYYGPELWSDEVGTNQLLVMADRRGAKPYLTTPEQQLLADLAGPGEDDMTPGARQHGPETRVDHRVANNLGARLHAGHWDAGFGDVAGWPSVPDGSRVGVVAMGDPESGPLLVLWHRPPEAVGWPAFTSGSDLLRLVVGGSVSIGGAWFEQLGFRLQQSGTRHGASVVGAAGARELWLFADRRTWWPEPLGVVDPAQDRLRKAVVAEVQSVLDTAGRAAAPVDPATATPGRVEPLPTPRGPGGRGIRFCRRSSDDPEAPFYVRIVDSRSAAVLAFTEPAAGPEDGDRAVAILRSGAGGHDSVHDSSSGRWYFRFTGSDGDVLFRSLPCASEEELAARVALIRQRAAEAPLVDECATARGDGSVATAGAVGDDR